MTKEINPYAEEAGSAPLSAKDVCAIIKSCRQNGVSSFKFRELALMFGDQPKGNAAVGKPTEDDQGTGDFEPDLDQMMVEDPVSYEKFLSEQIDHQEGD